MTAGEPRVFRYRRDFGRGERDVFSLLEPGWVTRHGLHPEAVMAVLGGAADSENPDPADVRENGPFLRLLSRVIYENVAYCDDIYRPAQLQGSGHVYLIDRRTPDPDGRVPAEDILGSVQVGDRLPVPGSYQHNPRHRLFTAAGWFRLPERLEHALEQRLRLRGSS